MVKFSVRRNGTPPVDITAGMEQLLDRSSQARATRRVIYVQVIFAISLSALAPPAVAQKRAPDIAASDTPACTAQGGTKPNINAVRNEAGIVVPLNTAPGWRPTGFLSLGPKLSAVDEHGHTLWTKDLGAGQSFSGFDLDRDGIPDVGIAKIRPLVKSCGVSVVNNTWLEFYSGATGNLISATAELEDTCHTHLNYASLRWAASSVLSGGRNGTIALSPQYSSTGWYWRMRNGKLSQDTFLTPTTDAFTDLYRSRSLYRQDKEGQLRVLAESQPPNGLIVPFGGEDRLVYFTSGRVLQYRTGRLSASQLIGDRTFFGRSDIAGRSYGLVGFDPQSRDRIAVVAGTHAGTVADDMISGKMASDPWGGIERHVTVYELARNQVTQKFFGSAHDSKDAGKYQNRIVYPAHMFVPVVNGPSRIAFNRFADGVWNFHVTKQGSPAE